MARRAPPEERAMQEGRCAQILAAIVTESKKKAKAKASF
jgi:hypothetical protein